MTLDKFIEETKPSSKLYKHRDEILKLKDLGYTGSQVLDFLKYKNIKSSVRSINRFYQSNSKILKNKENKVVDKNTTKEKSNFFNN